MIGSIRKHSKVLWVVIAALTIFSFVFFMGSGPVHNGGAMSANPFGVIYGRPVKSTEYAKAHNSFYIAYWLHYRQWPDKAGLTHEDLDREIYTRLLLQRKAEKLDIHIGQDALVAAAANFLRSMSRDGRPVSMQDFVGQNLAPEGLTVGDLQDFLRDELEVQQMIQVLGLPGALVPPQEAQNIYDRENQDVSAQVVFFSESNYLAQASATPATVAQFYTNNMAAYRLPDRVQISYVAFEASNYLAQSKAELAKTNFNEYVDSVYNQYGATEFPDAKTPEEAKAKIRDLLIQNRALADAHQAANEFATKLFAMEPVKSENFTQLAKQEKVTIHTTAPFDDLNGPTDLDVPATFTKAAFQLSADVPFGGPVRGSDAVYVLSLARKLPSMIPSLNDIHGRVVEDLKHEEAVSMARHAGTNFYAAASVQIAVGKTFVQAALAAKQTPLMLPPFSLSTPAISEIGDHATIGQIKQAAFTTKVGHISNFFPTEDGGFVLFVHDLLPIDESKRKADMPQFIAQIRRARENEAFNVWLMSEQNRELRDTPVYKQSEAGGTNAPSAANQ